MYYDPYEKQKKKRQRKKSCMGIIVGFGMKLLALALAIVLAVAAILYFLPVSLFAVEPDYELALANDLPSGPYNVLLMGVDQMKESAQRSDSMMIASIDRDTLCLTSIQRDTLVNIDGHGKAKINAAYVYGGAELAMRTINETFDTNIMRYVIVDYTALVKLVDALGGIEVDVTESECDMLNKILYSMRGVFQPLGYTATQLTQTGENVHLDGLQALSYSRIRKIDSDFKRTSRQREVLDAMLKKLRANLWNPVIVSRFIKAAFECIDTNLSAIELISLGEKALLAGELQQLRLPIDGTFTDNGSTLTITNLNANIEKFREMVYQ